MGLITMSEKHNQLLDILSIIDNIKKEICKEYGINSNAVNLMLTL
jgi:hemerythrin-like domain-containing protein